MTNNQSFALFSGTSHGEFAEEVARALGVELGKVLIETFPDGEIGTQILESVRGRDVFVLQTIAQRPSFYLMELLILIDALKRASARSITAVIPYFGYARQDRKDKEGAPITAKLVANLLERAGATRVLTMDLHSEQIQGFFDIPVDNLLARPVLIEAILQLGLENYVIVAPDIGSVKLAGAFARDLQKDLAIVDKHRVNASHVEANALIGDVRSRDVLLIDDLCSTGETLRKASWVCKLAGARSVCAAVTHGLMSRRFEESAIEKMLVSNTVPVPGRFIANQLQVISVAPLFAKAIDAIASGRFISSLF